MGLLRLNQCVEAGAAGGVARGIEERRAGSGMKHRVGRERGTGWSVRSICKERGTEFLRRGFRATKAETKTQFSSPFAAQASAPPATVAASAEVKRAVEAEESGIPAKTNGAAPQAIGISQEHVAEIKAAIQAQQKFLGELVEQSSRWELDGAELRNYFSPEKRPSRN